LVVETSDLFCISGVTVETLEYQVKALVVLANIDVKKTLTPRIKKR